MEEPPPALEPAGRESRDRLNLWDRRPHPAAPLSDRQTDSVLELKAAAENLPVPPEVRRRRGLGGGGAAPRRRARPQRGSHTAASGPSVRLLGGAVGRLRAGGARSGAGQPLPSRPSNLSGHRASSLTPRFVTARGAAFLVASCFDPHRFIGAVTAVSS